MDSVTTYTVSQQVLIGFAVLFFGYLGFRRGVNRELLQVIGIAVGILVSTQVASTLRGPLNQIYVVIHVGIRRGMASLGATQDRVGAQGISDLVRTSDDVEMVGVIVFLLVVLLFYLIGQRRIPGPASFFVKLLGALAGVANAFLAAYYLFPILFSRPEAVIRLPSGQVQQVLSNERTVARMVAFFVFIVIAFGLYTASSSPREEAP